LAQLDRIVQTGHEHRLRRVARLALPIEAKMLEGSLDVGIPPSAGVKRRFPLIPDFRVALSAVLMLKPWLDGTDPVRLAPGPPGREADHPRQQEADDQHHQ
jgi:hypothetical protein